MSSAVSVNIKMYQVGELGDCFLLRFKEGSKQSNVLIDCGSFRNSAKSKTRLGTIVKHIKDQLKDGKLDLVVGTHQHNDHVSGFVHCEELFKDSIRQVWLSWLDDQSDRLARQIAKDQRHLLLQLKDIHAAVTALGIDKDFDPLKDILDFYALGEDGPAIPAQGIANLKKLGDNEVEYLSPGKIKSLPGLSENAVKVYVLGPPRDSDLLFDKDPKPTETFDPKLQIAGQNAAKLLSALSNHTNDLNSDEEQFPFMKSLKKSEKDADKDILNRYNNESVAWQKIDNDWLDQANQLALYLDSYTNNSSLVLAFELQKTKKVLLFAADAQTGNWLSWETLNFEGARQGFKPYDLLNQTVLYKVGHHASHNATLKQGLEAMEHDELVAMIPVDKSDPNITKENGWKMPAKNLYKQLKEKTKFRVLRMDTGFAENCDPGKADNKGEWTSLQSKPNFNKKEFFIEYTVFDK